jgi:ribosomal protein S18 acetylase RimI-like enzyme
MPLATHTGQIRKATKADLQAIVNLEKKCFPGPLAYSRQQLHYLLTHAHSTVLVETSDNTLHGFIIILYRKGSTVAGIETIDVDPSFQRCGIASRLLKTAENEMRAQGIRRIRLEVSSQNTPAINLYRHAGYRDSEFLPNYYIYLHHGSRDAFRMVKDLS